MDVFMALLAGATSGGEAVETIADLVFTTEDPTAVALAIPSFLEFIAVITGAICGALEACRLRLDILGVCVLAMVTALGGGLLRDIILPTTDIYILDNPAAVILTTVAALVVFFFSGLFYKLDRPIAVFDIISVALFTVVGADKALMSGYGVVACVFMGVLTGVGGGMFRDVLVGRVPNIFKSGNFYAICSFVGALIYFILVELQMVKILAALICIAIILGLRWASVHFNLVTAVPVDLTPRVEGPLRHLLRRDAANGNATAKDEKGPGEAVEGEAASSATAAGDAASGEAASGDAAAEAPTAEKSTEKPEMLDWSDTPERREIEESKERDRNS